MRSSPDPKVYRGALVGLGGIARLGHLPAFRADRQVASRLQIVGIVDDAPNAPRSFDGIPLLSQPDKLSDLGPLDFVDICTPTSTHLDLSLWGLSQGYHVLCEKPWRLIALKRLAWPRRRSTPSVSSCRATSTGSIRSGAGSSSGSTTA